jgi:hypothetical protein
MVCSPLALITILAGPGFENYMRDTSPRLRIRDR